MKKPIFINNKIYHIYNRGVEKRKVFLDKQDYFRFVHDLFEFNDEAPAMNLYYKLPSFQSYEVELRKIGAETSIGKGKSRKLIVDILAFCLMPNHFHLILKQKVESGVVTFMQKLGTGYTNYFNKKYKRVGALFQGRFKAVLIEKESHFIHLPYYIHANPIDIIKSDWREGTIKNWQKTINFLESYRWSSYQDYIGKKNFPSVTQREFFMNFFEGPIQYKKEMFRWLKESNLEDIRNSALE